MFKSIFSAVGVAVAASVFFCVGCGGGGGSGKSSELVGQWVYESGEDDIEKMELFKDGTGVVDGRTISWKVENKRFVILSSGSGMSCNYNVSGYYLTLVADDGDSTKFFKKGADAKADAKKAFERGKREYDDGDKDKAMADFNDAIQMNPNFAEAYFYRGEIYGDKNDYDKAIAEYTQAIKVNPKILQSYYARALTYELKEDYDKAIIDYTEVIKRDPNRLYEKYTQSDTSVIDYGICYYHFNRGRVYLEKKDYDKAIADFNEEIRITKSDTVGLSAAYLYRGDAYFEKKDYDKAIADFNEAIRLFPSLGVDEVKEKLEKAKKLKGN